MIRINLLPEEFRRSKRAGPKALALLLAASLLSFGALGGTGFLWFNVLAEKKARVEIAQEQLENLTPRKRYADALAKEKAEFEKRNKTIGEIAASRIAWTRKLDRMSEIVNRDVTTQRHRVWLSSLEIDSRPDSTQAGMKLKGFSAGPDIESFSNFHEDLSKDDVFGAGFESFTSPSSKREDPQEGVEPPDMWSFSFDAKLPHKDVKKKAPKKPAPAAAAGS